MNGSKNRHVLFGDDYLVIETGGVSVRCGWPKDIWGFVLLCVLLPLFAVGMLLMLYVAANFLIRGFPLFGTEPWWPALPVGLAFAFGGIMGLFVAAAFALRILPMNITMRCSGEGHVIYERRSAGLCIRRTRLVRPLDITVKPVASSHGDQGFCIYVCDTHGMRRILLPPRLTGYSLMEAKQIGEGAAGHIGKPIGAQVRPEGWMQLAKHLGS